jgi:hypothetical protein
VAEDGKPLEKSESILMTLLADSTQHRFPFDVSRMKDKWAPGLAQTIVSAGKARSLSIASRDITAPWLKGLTFQNFNFAEMLRQRECGGKFLVREGEPMFYARLKR